MRYTLLLDVQKWIYASFSAISMAFFLALFSAGDKYQSSISLSLSIWFFSASLVCNSTLSFLLYGYSDAEQSFKHIKTMPFSLVPSTGIMCFFMAVVTLISHYSVGASLMVVFLVFTIFFLYFYTIGSCERSYQDSRNNINN